MPNFDFERKYKEKRLKNKQTKGTILTPRYPNT